MRILYTILCVTGWAWLAVFIVIAWRRAASLRRTRPEVVERSKSQG